MDHTAHVELPFVHAETVKHFPLKRVIDLSLASIFLLLSTPIIIALYLIVRLSSKGDAVFNHERIGRGGIPFPCYKFRTMYNDSEQRLKDLLDNDPALREEWNKSHKLKNDPRITPLGKFLRCSSLDELPQLWNVIRGDISLVGPRPVTKAELEAHYRAKSSKILSIRPGITGLWQVSGRNNTSYPYRIQLDEYYVDNQSIILDLKILLWTIPALICRKGAY